jgi:hypothetical protein
MNMTGAMRYDHMTHEVKRDHLGRFFFLSQALGRHFSVRRSPTTRNESGSGVVREGHHGRVR